MLGKSFIYNQNNITLDDYEVDEDGVHVVASGKKLFLPTGELDNFIKKCLPVENAVEVFSSQEINIMSTLQQTLLANIEKLKTDPGYVKQATAINNQINTIINMTALQLKVRTKLK